MEKDLEKEVNKSLLALIILSIAVWATLGTIGFNTGIIGLSLMVGIGPLVFYLVLNMFK